MRRRLLIDAERAVAAAAGRRLTREQLLEIAAGVLDRVGGATRASWDGFLGFAAVMVNNAYWRAAYGRVPFGRRLLLLPRCLEGIGPALGATPAEGDGSNPALAQIVRRARELGYHIQVADGTPLAVRLLAEARMDAILGVSCMESLEKAFARVHQVGVPALAVPLLADGCLATATDLQMLRQFIELNGSTAGRSPRGAATAASIGVSAALDAPHNYLPLLREVYQLFEPATLRRLLDEPAGGEGPLARLLAEPHDLAVEWIARGGKRLRPFVTAAAYQAGSGREGPLPEAVRLAAVAVEAFHKASLVHDDIEDDDEIRYGAPTVHRRHGIDVAINVGDYLLGLGYRLIARTAETTGPAAAAAQTRLLAETHVLLARGQGCELAWRRAGREALTVGQVMRVYALKTSPAFEAAIGTGLILAGAAEEATRRLVQRFCRTLGVGFQVLNDLADWRGDVVHARPTLLPALAAMEGRTPAADVLAEQLRAASAGAGDGIDAVRRRFEALGVFDRAGELVANCRARALAAAAEAQPEALADLMRFLVDAALGGGAGGEDGPG